MTMDLWRPSFDYGSSSEINIQTITVPAGFEWHVLSVFIDYAASDTVATRQIRIQERDPNDVVLLEIVPAVTIVASEQKYFSMYPGAVDMTGVRDTDHVTTPLPPGLILPPGYDLYFNEESSGDTTSSEAMDVRVYYQYRRVKDTSS